LAVNWSGFDGSLPRVWQFLLSKPDRPGTLPSEGNVALYSNLFFNSVGTGLLVQPQNEFPRDILIFANTVVTVGTGIQVVGGATGYQQLVIGNASFARVPINAPNQSSNVTGGVEGAKNYLNNPFAPLGQGMDMYPRVGPLRGAPLDPMPFSAFLDYDRDFNFEPRNFLFRGGYEGEGTNPGWVLQRARKPLP
jgi:hypothetical protein